MPCGWTSFCLGKKSLKAGRKVAAFSKRYASLILLLKHNQMNYTKLTTLGLCSMGIVTPALSKNGQAEKKPNRRPNIIFMMSDDHAYQAISAYGSIVNKTPNIDRIANDGAIFMHNYCANSISTPSRACALTGKHSHKNGVLTWDAIDTAQVTFPKLLRSNGYRTGIFGKWHLGSNPAGFDEWMVYPGQGSYYNPDYLTAKGPVQIEGYSEEVTTNLALDFLKRQSNPDQPFLLVCNFKAPHRSWMPGPKYLTMYANDTIPEPETLFDDYSDRATPASQHKMGIDKHMHMGYDLKVPMGEDYWDKVGGYERMTPAQKEAWNKAYGPEIYKFLIERPKGKDLVRWKYQHYMKDYLRCVAAVDDNIGRILDYLKENNLEENTIVVYCADQGFYLGEHGWFDKRWMYEESFRMPLLMRWPNGIKKGITIDQLTQNIDFAPTLLEAAGIKAPKEMQGKSMLPLLEGKKVKWRDALYYHYYDHIGEHGVARHYGVRTDRYKLIHYYTTNEWELFDLDKDPKEMHSQYSNPAYADVKKMLLKKLEQLKVEYQIPDSLTKELMEKFDKK